MKRVKWIGILTMGICMALAGSTLAASDNQSVYEDVIDKGWISAAEFDASKPLSRAQAIKTILRMANLTPIEGYLGAFSDTTNHPDREWINQARQYGIVTSKGANRFQPDSPVTKKDLILWLDRVFNLPDTVNFHSEQVQDTSRKSDPEAYYTINKYLALGIITLDAEQEFHPKETLTMGEFALIIDRLSGSGIRDLEPAQYEGQKAKRKILEPR